MMDPRIGCCWNEKDGEYFPKHIVNLIEQLDREIDFLEGRLGIPGQCGHCDMKLPSETQRGACDTCRQGVMVGIVTLRDGYLDWMKKHLRHRGVVHRECKL